MSFVDEPRVTPAVQQMYDDDLADDGYVMALTRVWAHQPAAYDAYAALVGSVADGLTLRERGVLVAATAATLGDPYCALAWGTRLAGETSPEVAAGVLSGDDGGLDEREQALAAWARAVTRDPGSTTAAQVEALRRVGFDDAQVVAVTVFVAARAAFATVNGALGAAPDAPLVERAPDAVRAAVTWGRPPAPA